MYQQAQKLYVNLHKRLLHKDTVEQLQWYAARMTGIDWPLKNVAPPGVSIVQQDTLSEWIQQIQFNTFWEHTYGEDGFLPAWDRFSLGDKLDPWTKLRLPITAELQ